MKMMGSARRRRFTHEPVADSLEVFIREWSEGGHRRRQVVSSFERISIVLRWASRSRATSERLNRDRPAVLLVGQLDTVIWSAPCEVIPGGTSSSQLC